MLHREAPNERSSAPQSGFTVHSYDSFCRFRKLQELIDDLQRRRRPVSKIQLHMPNAIFCEGARVVRLVVEAHYCLDSELLEDRQIIRGGKLPVLTYLQ